MPSDDRVAAALGAVARSRDAFRSAVATTIEEVRGLLGAYETPDDARGDRLADELGSFAAGRIDTARLAEVLIEPQRVGSAGATQIERALEVLRSIQHAGDEAFVASVDADGSLADAVGGALARLGRAFGAARVVELVRDGRYEDREAESLDRFPFRLWNRAERDMAPPLVVRVAGEALSAGALADFMDGSQKIVLVVEGEAPPAALAPLVSPGVLVIQTDEPGDLAGLGACEGPAVAALVHEAAARFVHTPDRDGKGGALEVDRWPEEPDRRLGGRSVFQQREELDSLRAMHEARTGGAPRIATAASGPPSSAATPSPSSSAAALSGAGAASADPAGLLAAWLLRHADGSGAGQDR